MGLQIWEIPHQRGSGETAVLQMWKELGDQGKGTAQCGRIHRHLGMDLYMLL